MIIIAIVLSAAALFIVAYPILVKSKEAQPSTSSAREQLVARLASRDAAFQALRDLNFDHRVGKVTDEDFSVFEANLKETAADALANLDRWETTADTTLDDTLERAIASRRTALASGGRECPNCGRLETAGDKFCASCGVALPEAAPAPAQIPGMCPKCGHAVQPADRFCPGCGGPLTQGV